MLVASVIFSPALAGWTWQIDLGSRAYWIGLALLVVVLIVALVRVYREWQEIHDVEEPDSPEDILESFRVAHAMGELNDEEMRRVEQRFSSGALPPEAAAKAGEPPSRQAARPAENRPEIPPAAPESPAGGSPRE
jgi:uncharacterized membrane protein